MGTGAERALTWADANEPSVTAARARTPVRMTERGRKKVKRGVGGGR